GSLAALHRREPSSSAEGEWLRGRPDFRLQPRLYSSVVVQWASVEKTAAEQGPTEDDESDDLADPSTRHPPTVAWYISGRRSPVPPRLRGAVAQRVPALGRVERGCGRAGRAKCVCGACHNGSPGIRSLSSLASGFAARRRSCSTV